MAGPDILSDVDLFRDLSSELLAELARLPMRRRVPRQAVLFLQGDAGGSFYVIESGRVKVFIDDDAGNQVILDVLGPGDYFGELSLLDGEPRSASTMTVTDAVFSVIAQQDFSAFLAANPAAAAAVTRALVRRVRRLTERVRDLSLLDVYGRVANLLRKLADERDGAIRPKLTQREIANMVGSSREMVSRVMKELTAGGYVERGPDAWFLRKRLPQAW